MGLKVSVKLVSLFLVLSVCLLGYVSMSNLAAPTPINGMVAIDPSVEFKQSASTSYYFQNNAYVDKLTLTGSYIELNSSFKLGILASSGSVNVTIKDWDMSDRTVGFETQQYLAHVTIIVSLGDLPMPGIYSIYVNGSKVGALSTLGSSFTYNYVSTQEWRDFEIRLAPYPKAFNTMLALIFFFLELGVVLTVLTGTVIKAKEKKLTIYQVIQVVLIIVIATTLISASYAFVS